MFAVAKPSCKCSCTWKIVEEFSNMSEAVKYIEENCEDWIIIEL